MSQLHIGHFTKVKLRNVNIRDELHGQDHVPAMDLSIRLTVSNKILDQFDNGLRHMFYRKADNKPAQGEIPGVEAVSDTPNLRCDLLGPIKIDKEYAGYTLVIQQGATGDDIEIGEAEVNKFVAELKDGGSVILQMRIQASGVDPTIMGRVGSIIGREVEITLTPPAEQQQMTVTDGVVTPITKAKPDPVKAFIDGTTGSAG